MLDKYVKNKVQPHAEKEAKLKFKNIALAKRNLSAITKVQNRKNVLLIASTSQEEKIQCN